MNNLEGQTFAGYEIVAKLGQGGMGAVYKARQPKLDRLAALKVMASELAADPDFVARFKREATAAANLSHPNIVQVYSAGESEGTHYIAMEFVDGVTLKQHIERQGRLDPREAIAITVLVAEALQYGWNKARLIHRDIKPDNIFLSQTGEVKVGDLGLAKTVGGGTTSLTQTGMMMGSPHYISPEQARGLSDIDFKTDIYSLGCTLYHMLTGRPPYEGSDPLAVIGKHVHEPPPAIFKVWPTCPIPVALVVGKMLAKQRHERPANYEDLIEQLREVHGKLKPATAVASVSASEPTQVLPAPAPAPPAPKPAVVKTPKAVKPAESRVGGQVPRIVIGAGALAAVALIAGAVWWFAGRAPLDEYKTLFNGKDLTGWRVPDAGLFAQHGDVKVEDGELVLHKGPKATAATWTGELPSVDYELTFELSWSSAIVSFPVGTSQWFFAMGEGSAGVGPLRVTSSSLKVFGRGGFEWPFEKGKWQLIRLRVTAHKIVVWIDGQERFQFDTTPHEEEGRGGDDTLKPLAVFTCNADGAIRAIRYKPLGDTPSAPSTPTLQHFTTPVADAAWKDAVNLLPLIDPQKDEIAGEWTVENDELVGDKHNFAHIEIPYRPPKEYDYRVEFTPVGKKLGGCQVLAKKGKMFQWSFFAHTGGDVFGFSMVNNRFLGDANADARVILSPPELGRRHVSLVEVRNDGLRGYLDGKLLVTWKTDYQDMSLARFWQLRTSNVLGLGCQSRMVFHRVEVREVTGKGTFTRGAPAGASTTPPLQHTNPPAAWLSAFCAEVAALPAEQQVARVMAKLKELNPQFDPAVANEQHRVENGAVTMLSILSFGLRDISPLQSLPKLCALSLTGSSTSTGSVKDKGAIQDISPLAGMKLEKLSVWANQISDLSPLRGMPLHELHCGFNNELSDLTPLSGMPIGRLTCSATKVSDLSPLKNTGLATIMIEHTPVTSLAAIADLKLLGINMRWTLVQDLSPLRNMPLTYILCDGKLAMEPANRAVLRSIKSLEKINNIPAAEFWKKADVGERSKP